MERQIWGCFCLSGVFFPNTVVRDLAFKLIKIVGILTAKAWFSTAPERGIFLDKNSHAKQYTSSSVRYPLPGVLSTGDQAV